MQPTLGTQTLDIGKDQAGSSQGSVQSSKLESAMVVPKVAKHNVHGLSDLQSGTTVPKSKKGKISLPHDVAITLIALVEIYNNIYIKSLKVENIKIYLCVH